MLSNSFVCTVTIMNIFQNLKSLLQRSYVVEVTFDGNLRRTYNHVRI